ncbi:NADPH-dependent FMN reductase [Alcaligenes faecalis subsp. phenolicus]|uniref:NADPH-dependent FMN reductase n=1 Tax=Alcaligenes nematophilus TaxID=2994643 RepID=UPI002AA346E8|nr:NADPH-dependent FMN reductase [Alcaligenes phenolicus]
MTSPNIVAISASPSRSSKTALLVDYVLEQLGPYAQHAHHLRVRDLNPEALLSGNLQEPSLQHAITLLEQTDAVIVATPVFKASYSGLLKAFLDVLPQFGLAGKSVLPLATGGSLAHVLSLDYALRPVLQSMGARHVIQGFFLAESDVLSSSPQLQIDPAACDKLAEVMHHFRCVLDSPVADILLGHPRPQRSPLCLPSLPSA